MLLVSLLCLLLSVGHVSAHGFVHAVTIDGKQYIGDAPNAKPNPSITRQIDDVGPVKGASNPDLNCGLSAQLAASVADANPGSVFEFDWKGGDLSNWPHNTGPMLTYMTNCGTTCDKFDSTNAKWFKIDQVGKGSDGNWVQQQLMQGGVATVTIPATLKAGMYIIRHEIIALHLAVTVGGAEFYPSCSQLQIGGTGTAVPTDAEMVTFPGAYKDNDPGIYVPDIYDNDSNYVFPGPPVAQLASSSSSPTNTSTPSGTNPVTTKPTNAANPTNTKTSSPGTPTTIPSNVNAAQCRLVSKKSALGNSKTLRKRHKRAALTAAHSGLWAERSLRFFGLWR